MILFLKIRRDERSIRLARSLLFREIGGEVSEGARRKTCGGEISFFFSPSNSLSAEAPI